MIFEYRVSDYLWARYGLFLARRRGDLLSKRSYYLSFAWTILLTGLGAWSAFAALASGGSPLFLFIGVALTTSTLKTIATHRSFERAIEEAYLHKRLDHEGGKVRFAITDAGIREYQGSVVLCADWQDIVAVDLDSDILIVSLTGLRRIVIPRKSFGCPDVDLEELQKTLKEHFKTITPTKSNPGAGESGRREALTPTRRTTGDTDP